MNRLIVGVSGGPDSMVLLDSLVKANKEVVVAHVNYQRRSTAFRDEMIVAEYCEKHQLIFERCYPFQRKGNFQNWARALRYHWFKQLADAYGCSVIAVGHQLNDLVETYLLQKQRNSLVTYYGLQEYSQWQNITIYRPLLDYSKAEILAYCNSNNLNYGWDESNDDDYYQRNKLRQEISELDKNGLLAYKERSLQENYEHQKFLDSINPSLTFDQQNNSVRLQLLNELLRNNEYYYFTTKHLQEIDRQLLKNQHYYYHQEFKLSLLAGQLQLQKLKIENYSYQIDELLYQDYPHFTLATKGPRNCGAEIFLEDWPLTIRNWQPGDSLKMKYGTKKVSRFFIDNKITNEQRKNWPVVLNCRNEVILVPGWGADILHYTDKQNLYVIKL